MRKFSGKKKEKPSRPAAPRCPPSAVTGPPECACAEDNTAYFGNNHLVGHENMMPSARDCQRSCARTEECAYWTWGKGRPEGPCYLKTKRENVRANLTSYVSGSKGCEEALPGEGVVEAGKGG